ncbi:MAG: carbamoyl transferase, partial [Planctomycetes bacterium]|nr:carbamoyl transferase [Planctomycetota bacterium]
SSYGEPGIYKKHLEKLLQINADGSFIIDDTIAQLRNDNFAGLEALFGPNKRNQPPFEVDENTQKYSDIAVALQIATEDIFIKLAKTLKEKTAAKYLCIAGGVGLNCVANGYLYYASVFDNFFLQPAANDAGTALGAAYYIWHQILGNPRNQESCIPYFGPSYSDLETVTALEQNGLTYKHHNNIEEITARLLSNAHIVGWFQGRMEFGPRALGNRSILADPGKKEVVSLLNTKVKH